MSMQVDLQQAVRNTVKIASKREKCKGKMFFHSLIHRVALHCKAGLEGLSPPPVCILLGEDWKLMREVTKVSKFRREVLTKSGSDASERGYWKVPGGLWCHLQ